jgi:predicted nucleotidyltransferase
MTEIYFPTELHRTAVNASRDFFLNQQNIDTILLVNSLARGKATPESDIDMAILVSATATSVDMERLYSIWNEFLNSDPALNQFRRSSKFAQIHLDIFNGVFEPAPWEDGGAIDSFELEIGNRILYSKPLAGMGEHFKKLRSNWLPYYVDELQVERLQLAKESCLYELDHIPFFVKRNLHFHAFDKLYLSFQKFLQTIFIKHKTYPIAYNKWIKEQVVEILNLPQLYILLPGIIAVNMLETSEIVERAKALRTLVDQYC